MSANFFIETIGIVLLAVIYLWSGIIHKVWNFASVTERIRSTGIPAPSVALMFAILLEGIGPLILIAPVWLPWLYIATALMLAFHTILSASLFHNFWAFDGDMRVGHLVHFLKNLGLTGGLLLIMARAL